MKFYSYPYPDTFDINDEEIMIIDHLDGFNEDLKNHVLDKLQHKTVYSQYIFNDAVKKNYPTLNLRFSLESQFKLNFQNLQFYHNTDYKKIDNFICSFNGSEHVSRQFLVSALYKFNWFNPKYCTKNFVTFKNRVDGNISQFFDSIDEENFYRKFILIDDEEFYQSIYSIDYKRFEHHHNIDVLKLPILSSFMTIVSESLGTSQYPYVTEKFLYPVLLKTFWIAYAQPGYHTFLEQFYGFKKYNKIFNYDFDNQVNPVIRLVDMLTMLSKFEKLSVADWHDLYVLDQDTIQYNYEWYKSGQYLEKLKQYA